MEQFSIGKDIPMDPHPTLGSAFCHSLRSESDLLAAMSCLRVCRWSLGVVERFLRTSHEAGRQKLAVIGVTNVPLLSQATWRTNSEEDSSLVQDLDQKPNKISPCSIFAVVR